MTHITIADTDPIVSYTATASQTQFDVPWPFFADGSLDVYQTPVGQTADDAVDILTLTTHYTVTGAGNQVVATRRITLVTGATSGDTITIRRDEPIARSSDLAEQGGFSSETYNDEQDLVLMILQQIREEIGRALVGEVTGGPFDALSRRIENVATATGSLDATNLAQLIAEVASQLNALVLAGNAGYVVAEPSVVASGTTLTSAVNTWYMLTTVASGDPFSITLPSGASNGEWIRVTLKTPLDSSMPALTPASGDFVAFPTTFGISTGGVSGADITIDNAVWETNQIAAFGDCRGVQASTYTLETGNMLSNTADTITTDVSGSWHQDMNLLIGASVQMPASAIGNVDDLLLVYDATSKSWIMNFLSYRNALTANIGPTLGGSANFDAGFWNPGLTGTLEDLFQSLVTEIDTQIEGGDVTDHTTSMLAREQVYPQVKSWGGSSPTTVQFTGSGKNQPFTVINIGTAILTLEPDASNTTALIFCGSDGLVQTTASTGILVPPGSWVTVKRKQDRLGSVGDDLDVYAYGSEGVVLAAHTAPPIVTIATGVATINGTGRMISIAAESATSDDLDTITCVCTMGTVKYFKADAGDTITFKTGVDNISIGSDIAVSGDECLPLIWDGTNWLKFVVA